MAQAAQRFKPDRLLGTLEKHEVGFIVIGGYAVVAHGVIRATKDIDICPAPGEDNLKRLAEALEELEAKPVDLPDDVDVKPDFEWLRQSANWTLQTKFGRLDVMQDIEGLGKGHGGWRELDARAETLGFLGHQVRFCGYKDLLKMKRATGRPQDMIDLQDLKAARGEA